MTALITGSATRIGKAIALLILPPAGKDMNFIWKRAEDIPLKKVGSTVSSTRAVKFLIESDFVTGQTVFVDGGEAL